MYGITHFFNGFFMVGFTTRFIVALVLLIYLYSKSKSDRALKKGLIALVVSGVAMFAISIMLMFGFFFFSDIFGLFSNYYW